MHSAKPLDEFDDELIVAEPEEASTWKTSRRIPILLFGAAVVVLLGIVLFAREFQSEEPLQRVVVEGNRELQSKEVLSIAAIDRNSKFYDLDLRSIEQRIAKHGLVRRVSIRREMHPNTIVIHVDERLPLAMIRSSNGEPILVDNDLRFFLPKKLSGLIDPNKLLAVPVLTGITEKDTAAILEMSKIVRTIETMGDSSLREAMGELRQHLLAAGGGWRGGAAGRPARHRRPGRRHRPAAGRRGAARQPGNQRIGAGAKVFVGTGCEGNAKGF